MRNSQPPKTPVARAVNDMFFGHVSHDFTNADIEAICTYRRSVKKPDLKRQAIAIEALCLFEEKYLAEEALSVKEKRKPHHQKNIRNLSFFAHQRFKEQEDGWTCGMTSTEFENSDGVFISLKGMSSLDQQINDEGCGTLHDVVGAEVAKEMQPWRAFEFGESVEGMMDLLRGGPDAIADMFGISKKRAERIILQNRVKFEKVHEQCDVDQNGIEQMLTSLFNQFEARAKTKAVKASQLGLFGDDGMGVA
ncbi:MAG: helix-hairpin-helix domain-containing protein [Sideroxydans sp.]